MTVDGILFSEPRPEPVARTQGWTCIHYGRIQCRSNAPKRMHRIDARRSNDLFAKRCLQMAFVRGSETSEQIPDGSGRGLLEAAFTPKRADDKKRKGCSP